MNIETKKFIEDNIKLGLDYTFEDNLMQVYGSSNWSAETKEEYERFQSLIEQYKYEDELCIISAWCDISGFNYWVLQQQESNYVSIDVTFKKDSYSLDELSSVADQIIMCDNYFLEQLSNF
jgi:hypothetical protein